MKKLLVFLFLASCTLMAFGQQSKPRLGILPFVGATASEGEAIANNFFNQPDINEAFIVVPRTPALDALLAEHNFQLSGFTDENNIASLVKGFNADYVVSGYIRRLGNRNLIITTIISVEDLEQVAGDYREYQRIEEIRAMMPDISKSIITTLQQGHQGLPKHKLAIAPFRITAGEVNREEAEALAEILAVEITNLGRYAVLPRTAAVQSALQELDYQMLAGTSEEDAKSLGQFTNAEYVLAGTVFRQGELNIFDTQILHLENRSRHIGGDREYIEISDGIVLMRELAFILSGIELPEAVIPIDRNSYFWSIGFSAGSSFAAPWAIATVRATLAPFPYSFLEIGFDFGLISGETDVDYYSMYPFAHYAYFRPFGRNSGLYAGAGGGYMMSKYSFPTGDIEADTFAVSLLAGLNFSGVFDISYTFRTNFEAVSNKIAVGFTRRFK